MDDKATRQLDRLLADGGVSGPEADAILDRVLATVAREEPRRSSRVIYWVGAGLAAAAAAFVVLSPRALPAGELTARGTGAAGPTLQVSCSAGELGACPLAATLVFSIAGDQSTGFLSAYAEPSAEGGERVWYFSQESESPSLADVEDGTRVFGRGVKLSGTHRPGQYRVRAFVSTRPLGQSEMLAGPPQRVLLSRADIDLRVTE